jgi:hypothetical protein
MDGKWEPGKIRYDADRPHAYAFPAPRRPQAHRRPDGARSRPTSKPQPDGTLIKALARAWRWQRMLDDGVYASVSEIGDAENISKSYAPDLVEAIVERRTDQGMILEQLERLLPTSWKEQRLMISSSPCGRPPAGGHAEPLLDDASVPHSMEIVARRALRVDAVSAPVVFERDV